MKLTSEQCELIRDFVENNGDSIRKQYSGRSMYGKYCFGIVCDNAYSTLMYLTQMLMENDERNLIEEMASMIRSDSMGLSKILYFPRIEWCDRDLVDDSVWDSVRNSVWDSVKVIDKHDY
jgi:hypothetical protein